MEDSQIKSFFKNQTVFITGSSGFVGKVLLEKLLRECEDIKKIYVLLRSKKGKTPEERLDEMFNFPCFDLLKTKNRNSFEKVNLISGDCLRSGLGLNEQDVCILSKETTCVIHAAANVKFDQSLKEAACNVRATRDVLELAKLMENLKVFVFISTAFSHCIDTHAEEKFYEPPMTPENFLALTSCLDDQTLQAITPQVLGKWPNAYVFAKCISEDLIKTASEHLPVTMVRPAIVISSALEPMPGWIDNFYGATAVILGGGLGVIRSLHADPDFIAPVIPVDYVSNLILAATWKRQQCTTTTIYNYVGDKDNALTWDGFEKQFEPYYWVCPSEKTVWTYGFQIQRNITRHKIRVFFSNTVPAYIVDFVLVCLRKPPMAVKNSQRMNKMLSLISYFSTNNWSFDYKNVTDLWIGMNDEDKKLFNFNMKTIDWDSYYRDASFGCRLYLLKETVDTIPNGKRKVRILLVINYILTAFLYYLLYKISVRIFSRLYNLGN